MNKFFEGFELKTLIQGLQHTFVMFGATILVPLLTGLDISVALFTAGFGTILFHIITRFKVPVFLGSSFAFMPAYLTIMKMSNGNIGYVMGGLFVVGFIYCVVGLILKFIDVEFFRRIIPPVISGTTIILIGLSLASWGVEQASNNWGIVFFVLATGIFVKIFFEKRNPLISSLPIIFSLIVGYIVSLFWGIIDFDGVINAAWFGIPNFTTPIFNVRSIIILAPIALVTIVDHFGDIIAIGGITKKDYIKDPGIHRTLIGDGAATMLGSFFGGPGNTTYGENIGAVALTGNKAPVIMRIAAIFAILLSFSPKFGALINSVPTSVIGGIGILLFGMIAMIGVENMIRAGVSVLDSKNIIIASIMMVLGVGEASINIGNIVLEEIGLALLVGVFLNIILNFNEIFKGGQK